MVMQTPGSNNYVLVSSLLIMLMIMIKQSGYKIVTFKPRSRKNKREWKVAQFSQTFIVLNKSVLFLNSLPLSA